MDPVSGLSIASSTLQALDFSGRLLNKVSEKYVGASTSKVNALLEEVHALLRILERFSMIEADARTPMELELFHIVNECKKLIQDLSLFIDRNSQTRIANLRNVLRGEKNETPFKEFERRMSRLRQRLELCTLSQIVKTQGTIITTTRSMPLQDGNLQSILDALHRNKPGTEADIYSQNYEQSQTSVPPSYAMSDTVVEFEDQEIVEAAVLCTVQIILENENLENLCLASIARIGVNDFMQKLSTLLHELSNNLENVKGSPYASGIAWLVKSRRNTIARLIGSNFVPESASDFQVMPDGSEFNSRNNAKTRKETSRKDNIAEPASEPLPVEGQQTTEKSQEKEIYKIEEDATNTETVQVADTGDSSNKMPESTIAVSETDLDDLANHENIRSALSTIQASQWILMQMRNQIFPSPRNHIRKVLQNRLDLSLESQSISCHIEWQIMQYLDQEFPTDVDISSILTISGELAECCATTVGTYSKDTWLNGKGVLDTIKMAMSKARDEGEDVKEVVELISDGCWLAIECNPSRSANTTSLEYAQVSITGGLEFIMQVVEQLAWMAAVFRRPSPGQVTVSDIRFKAGISADIDPNEAEAPHFELSLYPPELSLSVSSDMPGQCWAKVFSESIVAYRFPITKNSRPSGFNGLQIKFDVLTAISGIQYPISSGNRLILAGPSVLLVPVKRSGKDFNAIQWHLFDGEDRFEASNKVDNDTSIRHTVQEHDLCDWNDLSTCTAFLGYYRQAGVYLATEKSQIVDVQPTQVKSVGHVTSVNRNLGLNIGLNMHGATLSGNMQFAIAQRESAVIPGNQIDLDQRLRRASNTPIILYDDGAERAFMVTELSLALHLVHCSLRQRELDARTRAKIPFADVSANCGRSAYAAIKKARNLSIPSDTTDSSRPFSNFVDDYLTVFEQRKDQARLARARFKLKLSRDGLRGFSYNAVMELQHEFTERSVPPQALHRRQTWWKFTKKTGILVLFGRNMGCPISSHPDSQIKCTSWTEIPRNHGLLVTTIPVLQSLKALLCTTKDGHKGRYMITNSIAWARPKRRRLFVDCLDGGACNPIQGLYKFEKSYWWDESKYERNPGPLEEDGAVIFSDNPFEFPDRQCRIRRAPLPSPFIDKWRVYYVLFVVMGLLMSYYLFDVYGMIVIRDSDKYSGLLTIMDT